MTIKITLWIATYVNDDVADDCGSKVFHSEAEAAAFCDGYADSHDDDQPMKYANYEQYEVDVPAPDVTVVDSNMGDELQIASVFIDGDGLRVEVFLP